MPRPNCNSPEPITEDTGCCPFRHEGCLRRMDSYRELLNHFSTAHTSRWPWADREGLTRVYPGPDASIGYDLSELTIEELMDLWTDLKPMPSKRSRPDSPSPRRRLPDGERQR